MDKIYRHSPADTEAMENHGGACGTFEKKGGLEVSRPVTGCLLVVIGKGVEKSYSLHQGVTYSPREPADGCPIEKVFSSNFVMGFIHHVGSIYNNNENYKFCDEQTG